ncbi:MAG: hypothetical protein K0R38_3486 [Polyangiaceae bacterium]|jgi:hypothetical protein|nr:hypothetical protein [Polyangiaceae bacterium]
MRDPATQSIRASDRIDPTIGRPELGTPPSRMLALRPYVGGTRNERRLGGVTSNDQFWSAHASPSLHRGLRFPPEWGLANRGQFGLRLRECSQGASQDPGSCLDGSHCRACPHVDCSWALAGLVRPVARLTVGRGSRHVGGTGGARVRVPTVAFGLSLFGRASERLRGHLSPIRSPGAAAAQRQYVQGRKGASERKREREAAMREELARRLGAAVLVGTRIRRSSVRPRFAASSKLARDEW